MEPTNYIWTETIPGIVLGSVRNNRIRWKQELFSWKPGSMWSDRSDPQKIRLQFSTAFERSETLESASLVSRLSSVQLVSSCWPERRDENTVLWDQRESHTGGHIRTVARWTRSGSNCPNWWHTPAGTHCRYFENSNFDTENRTQIVRALIERMPLRQPRRWQTCSLGRASLLLFRLSRVPIESVFLQQLALCRTIRPDLPGNRLS